MGYRVYIVVNDNMECDNIRKAIDAVANARIEGVFNSLAACQNDLTDKNMPDVLLLGINVLYPYEEKDDNGNVVKKVGDWKDCCKAIREDFYGLKIMVIITNYAEYLENKDDINHLTSGFISDKSSTHVIATSINTVITQRKNFHYSPIVFLAAYSKKTHWKYEHAIKSEKIAEWAGSSIDHVFDIDKNCFDLYKPDILLFKIDLIFRFKEMNEVTKEWETKEWDWKAFYDYLRTNHPDLKILAMITDDNYTNDLIDLNLSFIPEAISPKKLNAAIEAVFYGSYFQYNKILVPKAAKPKPIWATTMVENVNVKNANNDRRIKIDDLKKLIDVAEDSRMMFIKELLKAEKDNPGSDYYNSYLSQILDYLILEGYFNLNIADILDIDIKTVRLHRKQLITRICGIDSLAFIMDDGGNIVSLTDREEEVLAYKATGLIDVDIAKKIGKSVDTVKDDLQEIREKFKTDSTTTVIIRALRMGILKLENIDSVMNCKQKIDADKGKSKNIKRQASGETIKNKRKDIATDRAK